MGRPLEEYVTTGGDRSRRNAAICTAYGSENYSMQEIATAFSLHYASISRIVATTEML